MRTQSTQERQIRKNAIRILLANGMNHREVARALSISPSVVSYYRDEIRAEF